jgi:hypothetical protein
LERPQLFFVSSDVGGDGLEGLTQVVDLGGQSGEGEDLVMPRAVAVDEFA